MNSCICYNMNIYIHCPLHVTRYEYTWLVNTDLYACNNTPTLTNPLTYLHACTHTHKILSIFHQPSPVPHPSSTPCHPHTQHPHTRYAYKLPPLCNATTLVHHISPTHATFLCLRAHSLAHEDAHKQPRCAYTTAPLYNQVRRNTTQYSAVKYSKIQLYASIIRQNASIQSE